MHTADATEAGSFGPDLTGFLKLPRTFAASMAAIGPTRGAVLLWLLAHVRFQGDSAGTVEAPVRRIAADLASHAETVGAALAWLRQAAFVELDRPAGGTAPCVYRVASRVLVNGSEPYAQVTRERLFGVARISSPFAWCELWLQLTVRPWEAATPTLAELAAGAGVSRATAGRARAWLRRSSAVQEPPSIDRGEVPGPYAVGEGDKKPPADDAMEPRVLTFRSLEEPLRPDSEHPREGLRPDSEHLATGYRAPCDRILSTYRPVSEHPADQNPMSGADLEAQENVDNVENVENEKKRGEESPASPAAPLALFGFESENQQPINAAPDPKVLLDIWERNRGEMPMVHRFTPERRRHCLARLNDHRGSIAGFLADFEAAVAKAAQSPFCTGRNARGWKAGFDFFITNSTNFVKVLEGRYDDSPHRKKTAEEISEHNRRVFEEFLAESAE